MRKASQFIFALALGLLVLSPARATSFGTTNADLWWNPAESGWGIQFIQQADLIYATMYVYDPSGNPTWYVALMNYAGAGTYTGTLLATRGPWFGNPAYDPALVSSRPAGQMTLTPQSTEQSSLTYSVDGAVVTKVIHRYSLKQDVYSGTYVGAFKLTTIACANPQSDGTRTIPVTFLVTQGSHSMQIRQVDGAGNYCNYLGDYLQQGQFGQTTGSFSCSTGESGTYALFEMNRNDVDIRGKISGVDNQGCSITGNFAAVLQ